MPSPLLIYPSVPGLWQDRQFSLSIGYTSCLKLTSLVQPAPKVINVARAVSAACLRIMTHLSSRFEIKFANAQFTIRHQKIIPGAGQTEYGIFYMPIPHSEF